VVYFRKLSDVTLGNRFSTPVVSEILDAVDNSKYFAMIDCMSGFRHSPYKAQRKKKKGGGGNRGWYNKRAFSVQRMMYALATFQKLMTTVLSGMQGIK
jgi:hypothetical protein